MDKDGSSEPVEEAAVRWFVRRQDESWSASDQAELDAWLAAATAHRVQFLRVATTWQNSERLKALGAGVVPGVVPPRGAWGDQRFFKGTAEEVVSNEVASAHRSPAAPWLRRLSLAASLLIVFATAIVFNSRTDYFTGEHYTTKVGGLNNVPLADGSSVTLNTDTSIRVALGDDERRIRLERGEAFFEVAKNRTKPFVVYAGNQRVIAVGTKFSVRRENDDVQVIVAEGRVRVEPGPDVKSTFLDAGEVARATSANVSVTEATGSRAEQMLAWRTGFITFQDTPLSEAVAEFNRYTSKKIVIDDPRVAAILVGGNFRSNNVPAFLDLLEAGFPIKVEQGEDRITLASR